MEAVGLGIGDAYGVSYFSGVNISISGAFVSCVLSLVSAVVLMVLDENGIAFFIACAYWIWQMWDDYGEMAQMGGIVSYLLVSLESVIMLIGLFLMKGAQGKIRALRSSWNRSDSTVATVKLESDGMEENKGESQQGNVKN